MALPPINNWQTWDDNLQVIKAWYTRPCLDELEKMNFSDKIIFEFGCSHSTIWWAKKAKYVYAVESSKEWYNDVLDEFIRLNITNAEIFFNDTKYYPQSIGLISVGEEIKFDVVVIDGDYREECVSFALKYLKDCGMLIYDNWMQPSVEVQSEKTQQLLTNMEHKIYKEPTHIDWQTLIAIKHE